jgi:hypothetical protein
LLVAALAGTPATFGELPTAPGGGIFASRQDHKGGEGGAGRGLGQCGEEQAA